MLFDLLRFPRQGAGNRKQINQSKENVRKMLEVDTLDSYSL